MKKLFILYLLGLTACQPDNPQPNTTSSTNNNGTGSTTSGSSNTTIPCDENIPWKENIDYGSVTDIDGNEYKTVTIGNQEWMAENLKVKHYSNGENIPYVENNNEWKTLTSGAYCWYFLLNQNINVVNYENCFGDLYNWFVVKDSRNVCPSGWHVPSDNEWTVLTNYIAANGYSGTEGKALKSITGWRDDNGENGNGEDVFGFRFLPGGHRSPNGIYPGQGDDTFGYVWSSTKYSIDSSLNRRIGYHSDIVARDYDGDNNNVGASIRCLRD